MKIMRHRQIKEFLTRKFAVKLIYFLEIIVIKLNIKHNFRIYHKVTMKKGHNWKHLDCHQKTKCFPLI